MKYIFISFVVVCILCSCKQTEYVSKSNKQLHDLFKIVRIEKDKSVYILYAENSGSLFKIVSEKRFFPILNSNKVMKDKSYPLDLEVVFPIDTLFGMRIQRDLNVEFGFKKSSIPIEKESYYKLYIAKNLKGLRIISGGKK